MGRPRETTSTPQRASIRTWVIVNPPDKPEAKVVYDVRSGAPGNSLDGKPYAEF